MPPTAVVTGGAGGIGSAVCRRLDSVTRSLGRRARGDERARDDLGPDGITVHAISPGLTRTPRGRGGPRRRDSGGGARGHRRPAIPRLGTREDLVGLVPFLTGKEAAFVTGQFNISDGEAIRR
jgi:NAD(P)-dependent dehydrogenase (short-subunit alcohol dehydrogenase family)